MATETLNIRVREDGTRVVRRNMAAIGTGATTVQGSVNRLGRALTALGAIAAPRRATQTIAGFGEEMATLRGIAQATDGRFAELRRTALELGATTRFSASEAASGMTFLARAGFEVDEALSAIGPTLDLATAGQLGLARAADIASNVLQGFRLEADQTGRVTDVLALTAASANTDVEQLGQALSFAAPIAAGLGVSVEETSAAIGALSDAGIQASRAGTGLARVMTLLENPSSKMRRVFAELGVEVDDLRPSAVGLTSALAQLRAAGVTTAQALELFGQRGGPAAEVLLAAIEPTRELTGQLSEAGGFAQQLAATMDDTLAGALRRVRSAGEALILAFADMGGGIGPGSLLRSGVEALAALLRATANNVEILAGALVGLAIAAIPKAVAALKVLTVAIASTGIGALAVLAGAAVGTLVAFGDQIRLTSDGLVTLRDFGVAAFEVLAEHVTQAWDAVRGTFGELSPLFRDAFDGAELSLLGFLRASARAADTWVGVWRGSAGAARNVLQLAADRFAESWGGALNTVIGAAESATNAVRAMMGEVSDRLREFLRRTAFAADVAADAWRRAFSGDASGARRMFALAAEQLTEAATEAVDGFGRGVAQRFARLSAQDLFPRLPGEVVPQFETFGEAAGAGFADGFGKGVGALDAVDRIADRARQLSGDRRIDAALGEFFGPIEAQGGGGAAGRSLADSLGEAAGGGRGPLDEIIKDLNQQAVLLRKTNRERAIGNDLLRIEQRLAKQKIKLGDDERELLDGLVRRNQALREQAEILDDIRGPQEALERGTAALIELHREGKIAADEYADALRRIQIETLDTQKSLEAGFQRGLLKLYDEISDGAAQVERTMVNAFRNAEDALVGFVTKGELDFSRFVDSLMEDLARLALRQALLGAVNFLAPGLGTGAGAGAGLLGRATGGPVETGRPVIVGERGPEMFVPTAAGRIEPNAPAPEQPPPVVNVVNVTDKAEVAAAMNSPEATQVILNAIRHNRRTVKQTLG